MHGPENVKEALKRTHYLSHTQNSQNLQYKSAFRLSKLSSIYFLSLNTRQPVPVDARSLGVVLPAARLLGLRVRIVLGIMFVCLL